MDADRRPRGAASITTRRPPPGHHANEHDQPTTEGDTAAHRLYLPY